MNLVSWTYTVNTSWWSTKCALGITTCESCFWCKFVTLDQGLDKQFACQGKCNIWTPSLEVKASKRKLVLIKRFLISLMLVLSARRLDGAIALGKHLRWCCHVLEICIASGSTSSGYHTRITTGCRCSGLEQCAKRCSLLKRALIDEATETADFGWAYSLACFHWNSVSKCVFFGIGSYKFWSLIANLWRRSNCEINRSDHQLMSKWAFFISVAYYLRGQSVKSYRWSGNHWQENWKAPISELHELMNLHVIGHWTEYTISSIATNFNGKSRMMKLGHAWNDRNGRVANDSLSQASSWSSMVNSS